MTFSFGRRLTEHEVVTGFFGQISGGLLQKFGRGYSDFLGALVAVGVKGKELQVVYATGQVLEPSG